MRLFGFAILRAKNMDAIHARTKQLKDDLAKKSAEEQSQRRTADIRAEEIVALKVKASRVNVSRLQNALQSIADNSCCDGCQEAKKVAEKALKEQANAVTEAMSDIKVQGEGSDVFSVLQDPLVSSSPALENGNQE